jgi:hypothetical protein
MKAKCCELHERPVWGRPQIQFLDDVNIRYGPKAPSLA